MGGPVENFAALLHMTVHSLTKSAIFFAVGHAAQKARSQLMDDIRGLITLNPTVGWGLHKTFFFASPTRTVLRRWPRCDAKRRGPG